MKHEANDLEKAAFENRREVIMLRDENAKLRNRLNWIQRRCDEYDSFGDEIDTDDVRGWLTEPEGEEGS